MGDAQRLRRFVLEAKSASSLNHPNIGAIHGLEETDGVTALVLELVEGPTLAERLARGPLPIPEALVIARQIAEAAPTTPEEFGTYVKSELQKWTKVVTDAGLQRN